MWKRIVVEEDLHPIAFTEVENVDYQLPRSIY